MRQRATWFSLGIVVIVGISFFKWCTTNNSIAPLQIDIASILPLSGSAAEIGGYNLNAALLFLDKHNKENNRAFHLVVEDSRSTAKDGLAALETVYAKCQPLCVMVHQGAVSIALAPKIAERGSIMLYIGATPEPKVVNPLAFRMYPDPKYVAERTVDQLLVPLKLQSLAILWTNDEFGLAVAAALRKRADKAGLKILADESYLPGTVDFRPILTKIRGDNPDALYTVGVGAPLGRLIAQSRLVGYKGRIISGPEIQFSDVLGAAGKAAEGVLFLDLAYNPASDKEPTKSFVQAYRKKYNTIPTSASAFVYDAWSIFAKAASTSHTESPKNVAEVIKALKTFDGVCGRVTISQDRDLIFPLRAKMIREGKPEWYSNEEVGR
jgi:branched-chain amino acid transport system substrate-binding protein